MAKEDKKTFSVDEIKDFVYILCTTCLECIIDDVHGGYKDNVSDTVWWRYYKDAYEEVLHRFYEQRNNY